MGAIPFQIFKPENFFELKFNHETKFNFDYEYPFLLDVLVKGGAFV